MKLILAILRDEDTESVSHGLIVAGFRVTRIASTGGFLRRGNATMMVGVEDDKLDQAIQVLRENCSPPSDPIQRRATLFVLDVARFDQI
jgi:uncharacterized protein YaaQ